MKSCCIVIGMLIAVSVACASEGGYAAKHQFDEKTMVVVSEGDADPVAALGLRTAAVTVSAVFIELPSQEAQEVLAGIPGMPQGKLEDPPVPMTGGPYAWR